MELFDFIECFRDSFPEVAVEVYRVNDSSLPAGAVAIGGFFSVDEGVELAVYAGRLTNEIDETYHSLEDLVEEAVLSVRHELRHAYQYASRDDYEPNRMTKRDMSEEIRYLQCYDEIDAYGNVDLSHFVKKNGWNAAFEDKMSVLVRYIKVFGKNSPETKKLIKKAYIALNS